ncbi:MAG: hypothetical protein NWE76_04000, partial [Candidatus Bathyarchaeota archaeon]|nr:hypothetical protein [Candidatus Bathyarchaeota archaeon]
MLENQQDNKLLHLQGLMKMVDAVEPVIARRALTKALTNESEYEALMLFESLRERVLAEQEENFEYGHYLDTVENLREIAELSGQESVAKDLQYLHGYFEQNDDGVRKILKTAKRIHTYQGLRENAENN